LPGGSRGLGDVYKRQAPDGASSLMITPDTSKFSADWQREDIFISEFQTFALEKLPDYYFGTLSGTYHPLY
jgi:hypothetical protein